MFTWCFDKNLEIAFSTEPKVGVRYILPSTPKEYVCSIKKYPFVNKKELKVSIIDFKKVKQYEFIIPKGYCYDGATIPRFVWFFVGSNSDNKYLIGALVHDWMCENHKCIGNDRKLSTKVLKALFIEGGTNRLQASIMCFFVDIFQRFCSW